MKKLKHKTYKSKNKTKQNKTKQNKYRKKRKTKMKLTGGGTIIGQGTHGVIEIDDNDENYVFKKFKNQTIKFCDNLKNEFDIQLLLHRHFNNNYIYVPECSNFVTNQENCSYRMERIFPLQNIEQYFIINMYDDDKNSIFPHSRIGREVGINTLLSYINIDPNELSYNIGKMFSTLHFQLNLDGYDCELLYGIIEMPRFILIDFDKINSFEWTLNAKVYRKLDENTIDEKILSTTNKFAWHLYMAMSSMSLIPKTQEYQQHFIEGYSTYISNEFQRSIYDEIIDIIQQY